MNVSVIIPNYNHEKFLQERIESVLNQTVKPLEILILDDCSTDNSREIINRYAKQNIGIRTIFNQQNSGSTFSQWNKGVQESKGEFIWIAESDDTASEDLIEIISAKIDNDTALGYCQSYRMNEEGEVTGTWKSHTDEYDNHLFENDFTMNGNEFIERFLIRKNIIPNGSAVIFRKSLFEKAGALPADLKNTGDWLAWLKLACLGKVAYTAKPMNYFRYHEGSVIAKAHSNDQEDTFKDWYGYNVRHAFKQFLKKSGIKLTATAARLNEDYLSIDKGNSGLHYLRNGNFIKGWRLVLQASVSPDLKTGFIKKALTKSKK